MRKLLTPVLILIVMSSLSAQVNSGVRFDKIVHNFGNVAEESNKVSTVFRFTNISKDKIYITRVETSCGCTTPEYTRDTILPGDTGYVKAIFETNGRGGMDFHKNLFVHFNKESYYQPLVISGYVVSEGNSASKPKSFPINYSNLAFNTTMAEFPNLLNTQKQSFVIKAYNYMGYPIMLYEITDKPDYVEVEILDSMIDVNDSISIKITVDGSKIGQYGETRRRIGFLSDDPGGEKKFLFVYTNLKEDFSKMSNKEKKMAPSIALNPSGVIDLGKRSAGEKFNHTIKITNNGKSDLIIRSFLPNCSCITIKLPKQVLAPGETIDVVLTIDTVNQTQATHNKYITLLCNDPNNPELKIKVVMDITR